MQSDERIGERLGVRPRVFYGWYIVGAGMGIHLWMSLAWVYGLQVFFTPIVQTFGWSRAAVSGAFALQRLEGSIASPIEGFLVDRFGPRKVVMVGAVLAGLGLISLSFLQAIWMFYVSVLTVSLGLGAAVGIPRMWAIVHWFRRLRGRAMGIGSSGAVVSGPLLILVVWLVEAVGWRTAFLYMGVATWFVCIPLSLVYRSRPQDYGYLPDGDLPSEGEEASPNKSSEQGLAVRQALKTTAFWILSLVFAAQTLGVNAMIVHLIPYFESIGYTPAQAVSVLGFFTVLSVIGRLGGGWAMDYFSHHLVLAGLLACQAAGFFLLANITSYWQVIPFALLYGTAFGGMIPSRGVIISAYFGTRNFGAIQGLSQSATVLGGMVGPVLMGWVFDVTGSYVLAIYILMGVAAVAIPLALVVRPPRLPAEAVA